jgi:glycosyltransferase involved in cell wall biosynthesis
LPLGITHGWGVCGRYLTRELAKLGDVRLLTPKFDRSVVADELEFRHLAGLVIQQQAMAALAGGGQAIPGEVLQVVADNRTLLPFQPQMRGRRNVGHAVFENNLLSPAAIENVRRSYDVLALGSSWCTDVLRGYGLTNVATVLQGVDPSVFRPSEQSRQLLTDRFVVFSGGKFELRKGQDLVIRAFKVLQDRHRDVMLVTQWYNQWAHSLATMTSSPYIRFSPGQGDHVALIQQTLAANGVDVARTIVLQPKPNALMASVYANTDVGLFPNRCEGGTNLVLMEYMACGRPVIASYSSGHRDVVNGDNAVLITTMSQMTVNKGTKATAVWDDPNLEETIERLEWAYQHRDELRRLGERAGRDLAQLTWARTAREFHQLLTGDGCSDRG